MHLLYFTRKANELYITSRKYRHKTGGSEDGKRSGNNDDLSLSEIGENFGITRQGARDAIKHGENALKELEEKVGFAARYRRVQQKLEELEQMVIDARFECTGPQGLTTTEYEHQLTKMLKLIRSIDEANES